MHIKTHHFIFPVAIISMAFGFVFFSTIAHLIKDWSTDDNFSHGFFIPILAGYMIWNNRERLQGLKIQPANFGLAFIVLGMAFHIVGNIGAELFTMRLAIILTLAGVCLYSFGAKVTWTIAIPIAYLIFMIPIPSIIWNKIAFPLQIYAARMTSDIVQLIGIPLLREGNILHLSNTTLEVVDACSGLRSLTSLLALSAAFAYVSTITSLSKWILFLSAVPIAVIVNIIRLTATALLATYIGPETAHGFLHDMSGILVFVVAIILLYLIFLLLQIVETKISKV